LLKLVGELVEHLGDAKGDGRFTLADDCDLTA
jgi:hypothetical protein